MENFWGNQEPQIFYGENSGQSGAPKIIVPDLQDLLQGNLGHPGAPKLLQIGDTAALLQLEADTVQLQHLHKVA